LLADPGRVLRALCEALSIEYTTAMLHRLAGRQPSDGVWAPAWYGAVERSTGFAPPGQRPRRSTQLPAALARIADQARPHYEHMAPHRLAR
jgi:Sulfotransferase domain